MKRFLVLFAVCSQALACSSENEHPPALNPNVDSGFADLYVPESSVVDTGAPDTGGSADADAEAADTATDSADDVATDATAD
jgi:hypothetical protein